jgi:hypothetical protein
MFSGFIFGVLLAWVVGVSLGTPVYCDAYGGTAVYKFHISSSICFNPLKTKRICFILGLGAYRAVNTLHFGYKNQSLDVL